MAKRKRQSRKKEVKNEQHATFWPLAGSILMILVAIFMLLGSIGTGGIMPKGLFSGVYWLFGWGAFIVPFALIYFSVLKFKSEEHQVP